MERNKSDLITYSELKERLNAWRPQSQSEISADWQVPVDFSRGVLTSNLAFRLTGRLKESPAKIAANLKPELEKFTNGEGLPIKVDVAGPYLNVDLTDEHYLKLLKAEVVAVRPRTDERKVMLEYIGVNVAKRMHAGHMRNLNIGDALRRLLRLKYPNMITDNHWGDWGVQFGIIIWAYKQAVDVKAYQADPIEELQRLYVWGNAQKEEVAGWDNLVRQEFIKLEQGDVENRKLWVEFVELSKNDLKPDLELLNVPLPDLEQGESFYEPDMKLLTEFMDKHKIWQAEGKARYFDLEAIAEEWQDLDDDDRKRIKSHGRCYLISSNGYTTYAYRDVATRLQWARDHKIELAITVIDKTQNHNFEQAFSIICYLASLAQFKEITDRETIDRLKLSNLVHVGYGFLSLTTGKMSTRKGNVLRLKDLVGSVAKEAMAQLAKRDAKLSKVELEQRSFKIAVAALKWADLNRDPLTDVVLDPKGIVEFEGNTGAYQLYTYARLMSVLRKAKEMQTGAELKAWELGEVEAEMLRRVYAFSEVLERSIVNYKPNLVTNHLLELTNMINSWYNLVPVTQEPNLAKRQQLIWLYEKLADHLKFGLDLLGIEVLEQM